MIVALSAVIDKRINLPEEDFFEEMIGLQLILL